MTRIIVLLVIMMHSKEDRRLIRNLHLLIGCTARKLMEEFPSKSSNKWLLSRLLKSIQEIGYGIQMCRQWQTMKCVHLWEHIVGDLWQTRTCACVKSKGHDFEQLLWKFLYLSAQPALVLEPSKPVCLRAMHIVRGRQHNFSPINVFSGNVGT